MKNYRSRSMFWIWKDGGIKTLNTYELQFILYFIIWWMLKNLLEWCKFGGIHSVLEWFVNKQQHIRFITILEYLIYFDVVVTMASWIIGVAQDQHSSLMGVFLLMDCSIHIVDKLFHRISQINQQRLTLALINNIFIVHVLSNWQHYLHIVIIQSSQNYP